MVGHSCFVSLALFLHLKVTATNTPKTADEHKLKWKLCIDFLEQYQFWSSQGERETAVVAVIASYCLVHSNVISSSTKPFSRFSLYSPTPGPKCESSSEILLDARTEVKDGGHTEETEDGQEELEKFGERWRRTWRKRLSSWRVFVVWLWSHGSVGLAVLPVCCRDPLPPSALLLKQGCHLEAKHTCNIGPWKFNLVKI